MLSPRSDRGGPGGIPAGRRYHQARQVMSKTPTRNTACNIIRTCRSVANDWKAKGGESRERATFNESVGCYMGIAANTAHHPAVVGLLDSRPRSTCEKQAAGAGYAYTSCRCRRGNVPPECKKHAHEAYKRTEQRIIRARHSETRRAVLQPRKQVVAS